MTYLVHRPTADPLLRLVAHALSEAHGRPAAAVWSAPYAVHLGSPRLVAAVDWHAGAAAAPRDDGLVRISSLAHPTRSLEAPLAGPGPAPDGWAAGLYAVLRALARAGHGTGGIDLHVHGALAEASGLATGPPLAAAAALAAADAHGDPGAPPPRRAAAAAVRTALPGADELSRTALFAAARTALLMDGAGQRHLPFDPAAHGCRLVLLVSRGTAELPAGTDLVKGVVPAETVARALRRGDAAVLGGLLGTPAAAWAADEGSATDVGRALSCALGAGALGAWWPCSVPGRAAVLLLPRRALPAVRAAVTADAHGRDRPRPRLVSLEVAGAARREE